MLAVGGFSLGSQGNSRPGPHFTGGPSEVQRGQDTRSRELVSGRVGSQGRPCDLWRPPGAL